MSLLDLKKQFPFDEPSIHRMDQIIDAVSKLMRDFLAQSRMLKPSENDIASLCEVFVYSCLGLENFLRGGQVDMAPMIEETFSKHIEQTRSWFSPIFANNLKRGVPESDIFVYAWEIFIRRLCIKYPNYMPPTLSELLG